MAECAEVFNQAFATDPNFRFFFDDTVNPKDVIAKDTREYQSEYRKAGRRFFKIVDEANGYVFVCFSCCYARVWEDWALVM